MRFMVFMYPHISEDEYAVGPTAEAVAAMTAYNEELIKAGVLLAADGLQPTAKGARVTFTGGTPTVLDGPFSEAKEVVGGYWLLQASSKEEAVEWVRRIPGEDCMVEVRQVYEMSDFAPDVQEAGQLSQTPPEQTVAR